MDEVRITGLFADEDSCVRGIEATRALGLTQLHTFSPFASESMLTAVGAPRSPVRLWVLLGGLAGCVGGFALTIGLSMKYPHVSAGMPIVSIPPFVIIAFELTILCGALAGLFGFLVHARLPSVEPASGYSPHFTNDRFGVVVECAASDGTRAEAALHEAGAAEVTRKPADES